MNKYEISIWEDYFVPTSGKKESYYAERKVCVIGSNTMEDQSRALEPNLVLNVNGTHSFTFKLYYNYIDTQTGETVDNPYVKLLVNERKVKVYWDCGQEDEDDKWYDLVVKNIDEDSDSHTITYTCEDLFINELGKTGFELNFSDEANNNQGTIYELGTAVLEGTDWRLDEEKTDHLLQTQEEALYAVKPINAVTATNILTDEKLSIGTSKLCFIPYSMVPRTSEDRERIDGVLQFIYADDYTTDYSSMVITNENSNWTVSGLWVENTANYAFSVNGKTIFSISKTATVSNQYRGNVYCRKQLSTYDAYLERYVNVYKVKGTTPSTDTPRIFGYVDYDYDASDLVNNLLSNNKDFKDITGWTESITGTSNLKIALLPKLTLKTDLEKYNGHSYLVAALKTGESLINSTFASASQFLSSGFFKDMKLKFMIGLQTALSGEKLTVSIQSQDGDTVYFDPVELSREGDPDGNGTYWYSGTLTCLVALAKNFLEDAKLVIKSDNKKDTILNIIETRLYELISDGLDEAGKDKYLDLYDAITSEVAQKYYYYYYEGTSTTDGTAPYIYKARVPCPTFEPVYGGWAKSAGATSREYSEFEKIRTIYGEQSNRFNLIQDLAETFKCWARFKIYHEADGSISRDENGQLKKYVYFSEKIGRQLSYGFTYGIDLNTIRRTQSSSDIVTKTIVLANYNENAPNGSCNIVDSEENYPRENFIYNFDYYINQGLLDGEALNNDLYYDGTDNKYIGYYTKLHKYNLQYLKAADRAILLRNQEVRLLQQSTVYDGLLVCAVKERDELIDELAALGGDSSGKTETDPKSDDAANSTKLMNVKKEPINKAIKQLTQIIQQKSTSGSSTTTTYTTAPSKQNEDLVKTIKDLDGDIETYKATCASLDAALLLLQTTIDANTALREQLLKNIKELHQTFYNKYSAYIQEGSWNSEDYIDPNLYYYDALSVAYTSSRPQVQYDIAVTRVSELSDFKYRRFHVGDITYIQDPDFFGYVWYGELDKVRTPYKEEVLISEININFDEPDKDTITVQNYKTQFEDLFQRITATTQSLQFSQGGYNRAAGVVNGKGEIDSDVLQDSLLAAADIVMKATDESVVQDNTGITLTNLKNLDEKVKITSGGIVFTNDGGETWSTMLKAGQIGVQYLSAGSISTSKITITDGTTPSFRWDATGLNAYWRDTKDLYNPEFTGDTNIDMGRFVRFDKFGIYGYNGDKDEAFAPIDEDEIREKSLFSLTWQGLMLHSIESSSDNTPIGEIDINRAYDIVIRKYVNSKKIDKIQIGRIKKDNSVADDKASYTYGMRICDDNGNSVLETRDDGSLWLLKQLTIGTGNTSTVKLGVLGSGNTYEVFNANDNFIINNDGTAKMTGELLLKGKYADLLVAATTTGSNNEEDLMGMFLCKKNSTSEFYATIGCYQDSNNTKGIQIYSTGNMAIGTDTDTTENHKMALSSSIATIAGISGVGIYVGAGALAAALGSSPTNGNLIVSANNYTLTAKDCLIIGSTAGDFCSYQVRTIVKKTATETKLSGRVKFGVSAVNNGTAVIEAWNTPSGDGSDPVARAARLNLWYSTTDGTAHCEILYYNQNHEWKTAATIC